MLGKFLIWLAILALIVLALYSVFLHNEMNAIKCEPLLALTMLNQEEIVMYDRLDCSAFKERAS